MASTRNTWRSLPKWLTLFWCGLVAAGSECRAGQSTFQTYGIEQGLASLGGSCMIQDNAGYLLVCTEHGIFAYDGRRFINLGASQGLRVGGEVYDVAITPTGRVGVRYADEMFVSDGQTGQDHSPASLHFQPVSNPSASFYDQFPNRLVTWRDGFVLLADDAVERVSVPVKGPAIVEDIGYDPAERKMLKDAVGLFVVGGSLWETYRHGRICLANPGAARCFTPPASMKTDNWLDLVDARDGKLLARSTTSIATLNPQNGEWSVTRLPDQGDRYDNYSASLGIYRTPDGTLFTQADHGVAILTQAGWRVLTPDEGAPSGTIVGSMVDSNGAFWFRVFGAGLLRWLGYGHWEIVRKSEGLSDGVPWQTARAPDGSVWVSTDTAIDQVIRSGMSLRVGKVLPGTSFALTSGPGGKLWRSSKEGIRIADPISGSEAIVEVPPINAIVKGRDNEMWLATQEGLFTVDVSSGSPGHPVLRGSPRAQIANLVLDGGGGVYYLASGRLRHVHADGTDVPISGVWPRDGFEPDALAIGPDMSVWIGGLGGLYRFTLSGDVITRYQSIGASDTRTNSIVAVMVDHRGWVWVGTSLGVSVFNGQRWVSVDADCGLLSDDVDEGGIREDPDGSVWITTTQGLSHLLDPPWLFSSHPIRAVISSAELGDRPILGRRLPYTTDALSLHFGTPNYGAEHSVVFRYKLSGVDAHEVESPSGVVRYAFVPPGRHILTVVAHDELTHASSSPVTLVVDLDYPWWQQWWAELLWVALAVTLVAAIVRLRVRQVVARSEELKRRVAEATEQLRFDRMTGLYIRSEIEERLAQKLLAASHDSELVVALLDIDHFKRVNDTYGHLGGDDVLRAIGRLVLEDIWDGEYAGRYGGEEILLILDDTDGRGAERVLHLLHTIRGTPFNAAGHSIRVTCSIGLAWAVPGDDWESLIGRADDALYEAKTSGRDRVAERRRGSLIERDTRNERRSLKRSY